MARKLLIAIALIIAAFPYLGFSHNTDTTVTTVLGLFMAAVLLFSKRPKMLPQQKPEVAPEVKPSPAIPSAYELPVNHPKEESFAPVITTPEHVLPMTPSAIPSPIQTPQRKRTRMVRPVAPSPSSHEGGSIPAATAPLVQRRPRKQVSRLTLSEEEQVPPADIPLKTNINQSEESSVETYS